MKHKTILISLAILITLTTLIIILSLSPKTPFTGNTILDEFTHTKALCNETNFCQDYIISCKGNETKKITPISGATIQHTKDWKDPRNNAKTLC